MPAAVSGENSAHAIMPLESEEVALVGLTSRLVPVSMLQYSELSSLSSSSLHDSKSRSLMYCWAILSAAIDKLFRRDGEVSVLGFCGGGRFGGVIDRVAGGGESLKQGECSGTEAATAAEPLEGGGDSTAADEL